MTGGWLGAAAIIAALYARRRTGVPQSVSTSLLGAGMTLKAGSFVAGDTIVEGPIVGPDQTGYGAAYRIYQAADGTWVAIAAVDEGSWDQLRRVVAIDDLPRAPPALRVQRGEGKQQAEKLLEDVIATRNAADWLADLRLPACRSSWSSRKGGGHGSTGSSTIPSTDSSDGLSAGSRGPRGCDRPGRLHPPPRPRAPTRGAPSLLPGLGQHTVAVLEESGSMGRPSQPSRHPERSPRRDGAGLLGWDSLLPGGRSRCDRPENGTHR